MGSVTSKNRAQETSKERKWRGDSLCYVRVVLGAHLAASQGVDTGTSFTGRSVTILASPWSEACLHLPAIPLVIRITRLIKKNQKNKKNNKH